LLQSKQLWFTILTQQQCIQLIRSEHFKHGWNVSSYILSESQTTQNVLWSRASVCLSVCLSAAIRPHYCTDPDVTWGRGRGCPLVVHCWADLQSGHGLRCYGNITRTLVTSLRPSCDMTT